MNIEESAAMRKCVDRVIEVLEKIDSDFFVENGFGSTLDFRRSALMRLSDCHATVPIDFCLLLEVDSGSLIHDVFGVMSHWDWETQTLRDCFMPRCAKKAKVSSINSFI